MKRRLFLRLTGILVVLAGLLSYSYSTIVGILGAGREEIEIVNATGRQRMLVQQFVRQANLALVGLSLSDWNTLIKQRELSEETSAEFDRTMEALLNGGSIRQNGRDVVVPKIGSPEVRALLEQIASIWKEVQRSSVKVLRSSNKQLRDHPDLALMQAHASQLVDKVDETLALMQDRSLRRNDTLVRHQTFLLIGGFAVFLLLAWFVYGSIISPLGNTIEKLDKSEEQYRQLYAAAPVGLWRADLSSGDYLKANAAMAALAGASDEPSLVEKGNFFSLFPAGKQDKFASDLKSRGAIADFETSFQNQDGRRFVLLSARFDPGHTFAEGAAVDITDRKLAETELERTHKLLVETAHQAGMANIATNVLHNVGNILNSLNVSCSMAQERLGKLRVKNLADAVDLLRQNNEADPKDEQKDRQIMEYLKKLSEYFSNERKELGHEVRSMQENIDHIRTVITLQQSFANGRTFVETVRPADLFEEALNVNLTALTRHSITVLRHFQEIGPAEMERHKVLQILVNLISNAKHAMGERRPDDKRLELTLRRPEPEWILFEVRDNGIGFSPEAAASLFRFGFTTKPDGHGFGLHSSALAATEMGGDLNAHSDGPGTGALFTLRIPYIPAKG